MIFFNNSKAVRIKIIFIGANSMSKMLVRPKDYRKVAIGWDADAFQLSTEQKQELNVLYEGSFNGYKPGAIITGTIIAATADGILVDINYKSEGLIPLFEFKEDEIKNFKPGTKIEVVIDELESPSGTITLSYEKARAQRAWIEVMKMFEEGKPVEGAVTHKVKGGLNVDIGIPAFLPGSQIDLQRVTDFDQYVGQNVVAYIIKVNQKRGNVIISRRKYLNEQRSEVRKKVIDTLEVGQIIQGTVKNITNYGIFIDIGGVDGLLHITDMTWGRIAHPSEMLTLGDVITVKVLSFDRLNEKISLGLKQLDENPWEKLDASIEVGSRVSGRVSNIADYGLFIEVAKGVEALVHISEISWTDRISDLRRHYKIGDEVAAVVVSLDKENRRMSLSIKQLEKNPWDTLSEQYAVGQKISGVISNITDFGIFVQIMPGVDGLVHISDFSWTEHIKHPSDLFQKGQEIEAVITDINKSKKKVSLSIKQLRENPWENIEQKYPVNSMVHGEVTKITDFGAFVKLESGIEGLVHISELSDQQVNKVDDVLKVGQEADFRIVKVSQEERKIGLSLKAQRIESEEEKVARTATKKTERAASAPRRSEKYAEAPAQQSNAVKVKSQLQLELEKHAARSSGSTEENTGE